MSACCCHCQMPQSVVPQSPYDPQFQLFVFVSSFSPDWHSSPSKLPLTLLYLFTIVYQGPHPLCPVWVFPMTGLVVIESGHHPGRAGALAGQGQRHTAQAGGVVTGVAVQLVTAQVLYLPPFILHFKSRLTLDTNLCLPDLFLCWGCWQIKFDWASTGQILREALQCGQPT